MTRTLRERLLAPWVVMPVVALLALGGWFVLRPDDDGAATDLQAVATDQTVAVTVGTMAQTVSAEGTVAASETEDLSFTASGEVTAVNVAAGDQVKTGQVLASLDSAELEAAVVDAEASLADAEATLADDTDADASDEQLEVDEAAVTAAQDQLDAAYEDLAGASLVASFDGTVASVDLTVGEELATGGTGGTDRTGSASGSGQSAGSLGDGASSPIGGATESTATTGQIQIVSTDSFTVELGLDATEVADVKVGQVATVSLSTSSSTNAFPGFPGGGFPGGGGGGFPGADTGATPTTEAADAAAPAPTGGDDGVTGLVTEVASVADASSGVASYAVTVAFTDDSGTFNVGATASVDITYAEVADAISVPARAVTTTGTTSTVTVRADGEDETRTVTTGLTAGTMVQITSGLAEGEEVVVSFPGRPTQGGGAGELPSGGIPGGAVTGGASTGAGG